MACDSCHGKQCYQPDGKGNMIKVKCPKCGGGEGELPEELKNDES